MSQRSVSGSGWPLPVVLVLALIALVAMLFVPLLLFLLLPVAAAALIAWGYVSYRHAEPGARAMPAAAIAGGIALLAITILLVAGLTVTSSSGGSSEPIQVPIEGGAGGP